MLCLGPVCTTPNGWCVLVLLLTGAAVVWAWGKVRRNVGLVGKIQVDPNRVLG